MKYRLFALLCCAVFALAGCSKNTPEATPQASPGSDSIGDETAATQGGTINIAFTGSEERDDDGNLTSSARNPLRPSTRDMYDLHQLVFEGLVRFDENQRPIPALAENWEVDETGTSYVFELRKGVKFHNGTEMTAEDVVHTLDILKGYYAEGQTSMYAKVMSYIASYEADGTHKLKVTLHAKDMRMLYGMYFPIVPKGYDGALTNNTIPVGTGPYKVDKAGESEISLSVNENWWRERPYIDTIVAKKMPDIDTSLTSLEAKQVDLVHSTSLTANRLRQEGTINVLELMTNEYECIIPNISRKPLDDARMREALICAIDRNAIITETYLGHAVSADSPISPNSHLFDATQAQHEYNPGKAKTLLEELGFTRDENSVEQMLVREGFEYKLKIIVSENPSQNSRVEAASMVQEQLREVGLDSEVKTLSASAFREALKAGDFDLALAGFSIGSDGDLSFLIHSLEKGTYNYGGYYEMEMDSLLDQYVECTELEQAKEVSSKIQQKFAQDMPMISLYFHTNTLVYSDNIKAIAQVHDSQIYADVNLWHIFDVSDSKTSVSPSASPSQTQ